MNEDPGYTDGTSAGSGRTACGRRPLGMVRTAATAGLWLAGGGVVVVAAAAVPGILKFGFPPDDGPPAHEFAIPAKIGTYVRTVDLEHEASLTALRDEITETSAGQASHVVSAVYESGDSGAGGTTQIIMFIGGRLANDDPTSSIASFTRDYPGVTVVSAVPLAARQPASRSRQARRTACRYARGSTTTASASSSRPR